MSEQVRFIHSYSVVRTPDGEVGYLVHATDDGVPAVAVSDGQWIQVEPTSNLEVLAQPGTTAQCWITAYERSGSNG